MEIFESEQNYAQDLRNIISVHFIQFPIIATYNS